MLLLSLVQRASGRPGRRVPRPLRVRGLRRRRSSPGRAALLAAVGVGGLVGSDDHPGRRLGRAHPVVVRGRPSPVRAAAGRPRRHHRGGPAMLALGVCGAGAAWALIYGSSLVTRLLPDHVAGRGWGALLGLGAGAAALGSLAAPLLARCWDCRTRCSSPGCSRPSPSWSASRGCVPWPVAPSRAPRTSPCSAASACSHSLAGDLHRGASPWQPGAGRSSPVRWSSTEGELGQEFFVVADGELVVSVEGRRGTPPPRRRRVRRGGPAASPSADRHRGRHQSERAADPRPRRVRHDRHRSPSDGRLGRSRRGRRPRRGRPARLSLPARRASPGPASARGSSERSRRSRRGSARSGCRC